MIRHGSFVHAVVRGPSRVHVYVYASRATSLSPPRSCCFRMRVTVTEGSGKSRMCLQHGGNLEAPRISAHTTEISVKADFPYALRYDLEWFIRFWKHPFDHGGARTRENIYDIKSAFKIFFETSVRNKNHKSSGLWKININENIKFVATKSLSKQKYITIFPQWIFKQIRDCIWRCNKILER